MVGRVGDTPLPGCGLYADDQLRIAGEGFGLAGVVSLGARNSRQEAAVKDAYDNQTAIIDEQAENVAYRADK